MPESLDAGGPARLRFESTAFDAESGQLTLRWVLQFRGRRRDLVETFHFGAPRVPLDGARLDALEAAIRLLHWIAGVSYWKVACRGEVEFGGVAPDRCDAELLEAVYRDGLAELAWRNQLAPPWWPDFHARAGADRPKAEPVGLAERALVTMGGGKDSLVALERARRSGIPIETVQVGEAPLIGQVAERTGLVHHRIRRRLDPGLADLNAGGALNGHVPITAINAAALTVAALLWDFRYVVFANERSADQPTLEADGQAINHQWAKSLAFEAAFDERLRQAVASDLRVFSLLRRERELGVVREFAGLERYHDVFSSCNRNFHLEGPRTERWCGHCPKCLFVFLALAPFLPPDALRSIFGSDLLEDPERIAGFAALLELEGHRPFECVGEADEARAAVRALAADPQWAGHAVVRALSERIAGLDVPPLDALCRPSGEHRVPEEFDVAPG